MICSPFKHAHITTDFVFVDIVAVVELIFFISIVAIDVILRVCSFL